MITRTLPATTISCWGDIDAKRILRTQIVYTADTIEWKTVKAVKPKVKSEVITAREFQLGNSGAGAQGSYVDFAQLRIRTSAAKQITIKHDPAKSLDAEGEIPGDKVLLDGPDRIVFSVCNLYFEAKRAAPTKR